MQEIGGAIAGSRAPKLERAGQMAHMTGLVKMGERSNVMDKHLSILAKQHTETRFLKVHAEKSPFLTERLRVVVLPTLALIKNAKVDDYVVGFDELGGNDEFSTEELEERLAKSQVLFFEGEASSILNRSRASKRSIRQSESSNLSDSD
ncbi:thioredoxin domain-containing protein 9 homolog [Phalaenopsis equestris]|uniref:thioredoxin domain-containing protein 9 homolog n=1 Tax=Phalaenopsis equestris TaxID=78828 RepID=UPI0009E2C111|nr:thioredoxin domain-containing protein 9 homolog [Phalaenopsis equestris]